LVAQERFLGSAVIFIGVYILGALVQTLEEVFLCIVQRSVAEEFYSRTIRFQFQIQARLDQGCVNKNWGFQT
jgi:hypothetical protein